MESNKTMLTPFMCEACVFRQRKRTSRRKLAYCLFIAYNAIILSVISATLWYVNGRLNRTEGAIAVLKKQSKTSEDHTPVEFSPLATKTDADEELLRDIKSENLTRSLSTRVNRMLRRKRSQPKKKRKKRCKNCLPVVQIEGTGGFGNAEDKSDLSNLWVTPTWVNPTKDKQLAKYFDVSSVTGKGKIKVKQDGLYFVYAQMNLFGPSIKGFEVFMEEKNSAPKCITSCKRNSFQDQTEHCFTMKVVRLQSNSSVYIQEMEANSDSHYIKESSVFGLVKIGS